MLLRQHHFGCLFAHLAQWQLAADSGNKHTFIFESDGFLPGLLAVPVAALETFSIRRRGITTSCFCIIRGRSWGRR